MAIINARIADNGHLILIEENGSVIDAGSVRGIPGPQGEKGTTGAKGDPGEPGVKGDPGLGVAATTVQNSITLGATVAAPTAARRTVERIECQSTGDGYWLTYKLGQVQTTAGSGDYLLTLPTGITFNATYNPPYTGAIWIGGVNAMAPYFIPAMGGIVVDGNWTNQIMVMPYDSTRFRVAVTNNGAGSGYGFWSSGYYNAASPSGLNVQLQFEIWK